MEEGGKRQVSHGSVNANTSLEELIAIAEGDTTRSYEVEDGGNKIGTISMQEVFQALVRYDIQHKLNAELYRKRSQLCIRLIIYNLQIGQKKFFYKCARVA